MAEAATQISFDVTKREAQIIGLIAARAMEFDPTGQTHDNALLDWRMDITACHANGAPLRLAELLAADDFNFVHDVFGISRHICRDTGGLTDNFRPRFAQPEQTPA